MSKPVNEVMDISFQWKLFPANIKNSHNEFILVLRLDYI